MTPPPAAVPLPDPGLPGLPYAAATPPQRSRALAYVKGALAQHFPTLSAPAWATALDRLQPALWVADELVYLDDEDLAHLAQRLAFSPELPELDPPLYNGRAAYLARRLVDYWDQAIDALEDIEAQPRAYGPRVYALVVDLALGNAVAEEVFRATHRGEEPGEPGSGDLDAARTAAGSRLAALRRARAEVGQVWYVPPAPAG